MQEFIKYLISKKYSVKSLKSIKCGVNNYLNWCIKEKINPETIDYETVLKYIQYQNKQNITKLYINSRLRDISKYFDYLNEKGISTLNYFKNTRIKTEGKRVQSEVLTPQQLEKIYLDYQNLPDWNYFHQNQKHFHQRNIVILGLLIYQGITSGDLSKIEIKHINLTEGKIYLPSTIKNNARTLKLQANQIIPLQIYISQTHQKLIEIKKRKFESEKKSINFKTERIIFSAENAINNVYLIIKEINKIQNKNVSSRQIRTSVIMNWLKQYNIRQVQYMIGHKSIGSTEKYRNEDLQDLMTQIEKYHPLNNYEF